MLRVFGIRVGRHSSGYTATAVAESVYFVYPRHPFVRSRRSFVASVKEVLSSGADWVCVEGRSSTSPRSRCNVTEVPEEITLGLPAVSVCKLYNVYVVLSRSTFRVCARRSSKKFRYSLLYTVTKMLT